jgi:DNA-binding NarL/FixJ family response regulator
MQALIADEWAVLRSGVAGVLVASGIAAIRETDTATEALAALHPGGAHLVVFGLVSDQPLAGAVRRAKAINADVRTIVLVPEPDRDLVLALLDGGADAVLSREASEAEVREALVRVARAERFVAPGLLARLYEHTEPVVEDDDEEHPLTAQERRVLALLVEGRSNRQIADELLIGEATVKTHLHNLYEKLRVANRVQAVSRAIEMRLLS